MSNGDIYKRFQETYPELNPIDYRPLSTLHEPKTPGIQIWLENGDVVLYFPKEVDYEPISARGIAKKVEPLPSIESKRETGHWIIWYEEEETFAGLETRPKCKCSVCGKYIKAHEAKSTNYCSNCGAYNGGNITRSC